MKVAEQHEPEGRSIEARQHPGDGFRPVEAHGHRHLVSEPQARLALREQGRDAPVASVEVPVGIIEAHDDRREPSKGLTRGLVTPAGA